MLVGHPDMKTKTSTSLTVVSGVMDNLPFIVRRDRRTVATFARLRAAQDWASDKSYSDESVFVVHTASEVLETYRDGESVDEK